MSFIADKQTLEDLNIQGRYKNNSVSRLFDQTVTAGGSRLMEELFRQPLTDAAAINKRSAIFEYFTSQTIVFPFSAEEFEVMENYLRSGSAGSLLSSGMGLAGKRVLQLVAQDKAYELLCTEVNKTIGLLKRLQAFAQHMAAQDTPYEEELQAIRRVLNHPKITGLKELQEPGQLSLSKLIGYDFVMRGGMHQQMQELMSLLFHLDVYIAVAGVARNRGFCYANALPTAQNTLLIAQLYHPAVENAIGNSLFLSKEDNVLFLTGANMAGKSTLMKSFGIAIYLAHMGFPIAAESMEFSVKDGLYTSINVPDNLGLGYSHFYAEVLRVKKVAEEVAEGKKLVAIFDELFKGTNVKDAYDATLSITEAFSEHRNCLFLISTHILEVGQSLTLRCSNFKFAYLPTVMQGSIPTYTYRLKEGITADRQGMIIIEKEGIIELLRE